VATCGRPEALARCLEALAAGTVRPREVLVVDQAPSPEARDAVAACTLMKSRYLEQPRLGLSASRNLALAVTSSPLLAVTDDDCVPDQRWVEAIAHAFDHNPKPAAVTGPVLSLGPRPPGTYAVSLRASAEATDHRGRMLPWNAGSGANFAAPRALLHEHGGWDERLGAGSRGQAAEDTDLLYRILRSGGLVRYTPAAVIRHEWQTRTRRLETRWSYGYGIGALCGLWLRRGEAFALRMLVAYARMHGRPLAAATRQLDRGRLVEHLRALAAVPPGLLYGLAAPRRPPGAGLAPPAKTQF
jgi:GT2 family glycosyltransferase